MCLDGGTKCLCCFSSSPCSSYSRLAPLVFKGQLVSVQNGFQLLSSQWGSQLVSVQNGFQLLSGQWGSQPVSVRRQWGLSQSLHHQKISSGPPCTTLYQKYITCMTIISTNTENPRVNPYDNHRCIHLFLIHTINVHL